MDKILNLLGLSFRANKLLSGEEIVIKSIQKKEAKLVIIAKDSSEQTQKMFTDKCYYYKVPYIFFGTKELIGASIGKSPRSACAIIDKGFVQKLLSMVEQNHGGEQYE